MNIIDTHAHLDHIEDIDKALAESFDAGVEAVIAVSEGIEATKKNLEIKNRFNKPKIYLAAGIHPSEVSHQDADAFIDYARNISNELTAIGEIGLDYWYRWVRKNDDKKAEQKEVFKKCLILARDLDLPVSIHSRGAWSDCLEMVKELRIKKAVFHWYSGPIDVLKEILDAGFLMSVTPSLSYSDQAKEAAQYASVDKILIETDTPVYYKNKDDESGFKANPKDVFKTLDLVCELKSLDRYKALNQFNQNAKDFFNLNDK